MQVSTEKKVKKTKKTKTTTSSKGGGAVEVEEVTETVEFGGSGGKENYLPDGETYTKSQIQCKLHSQIKVTNARTNSHIHLFLVKIKKKVSLETPGSRRKATEFCG